MGMFERMLNECIFIDFGSEIRYGSDQVSLFNPVRFPTVTFQLMGNGFLTELVDWIRKDKGFVPLYPMDEYTSDTCDNQGWYDFSVGINDFDQIGRASCRERV